MFRLCAPVALCMTPLALGAQDAPPPQTGGQDAPADDAPACRNLPYSDANCARVLACIGAAGLWFDGEARGWDTGIVTGRRSDAVPCAGHWRSGGVLGTGTARLQCADGLSVDVLYYTQDNVTGTVTGRGQDSVGRAVIAWSGTNVLRYLTPEGAVGPELPCGPAPIPLG